ncbi:hypothetical protein, partial [Burkholderia gladioli]|uniref:hypothetical protein n=1 Tax=Burkholderia gladioli TaxID=28095 RepID=UPI001ABB9484
LAVVEKSLPYGAASTHESASGQATQGREPGRMRRAGEAEHRTGAGRGVANPCGAGTQRYASG